LQKVLDKLADDFFTISNRPEFIKEFEYYLKEFVGRENQLPFAENLMKKTDGAKYYLKREAKDDTAAHKKNNEIVQIGYANHMSVTRVIAEIGAGQYGVATATACAMFDIPCVIYMGKEDMERQAINVFKMELLGAEVVPVTAGQGRLKDAVDAALADLVEN